MVARLQRRESKNASCHFHVGSNSVRLREKLFLTQTMDDVISYSSLR